MTTFPTHGGMAPDAFDVVHRGQMVSFPAGRLAVDPLMRATIEAADADVIWDDAEAEPVEPDAADVQSGMGIRRGPGRPRKQV